MRLHCITPDTPDWFKKFVKEEWGDEFRPIQEQSHQSGTLVESVVSFYKGKGITAWREGYSVWIDVDLNDPAWTMRMLKYEGETE